MDNFKKVLFCSILDWHKPVDIQRQRNYTYKAKCKHCNRELIEDEELWRLNEPRTKMEKFIKFLWVIFYIAVIVFIIWRISR